MKKKPPPPPFWRNPRKLGLAIGMASAVLVSAGAAAIMLNSPGDFSTVPGIKRLTSTRSTGESSTPSPTPATAAASTSATTSSSESPTPETSAPQQSASAPAPSRSAAPTPSSPRQSPPSVRVEATRTPMSFHPSTIPKP